MVTSTFFCFFFFNDPATTEIYTVMNTLSLHDALPIRDRWLTDPDVVDVPVAVALDRRSEEHTSELQSLITISYAVFCLKKKSVKVSVCTVVFADNQYDQGPIILQGVVPVLEYYFFFLMIRRPPRSTRW